MNLAIPLLLLLVGFLLSAFFSGNETGFYRASRVRLVLDARGGDWVARGLVWLTNNPAVFVATTLIGNNMANYLISRAVVTSTERLFEAAGATVDLLASVLASPIVFLYGELLPKHIFFHAPNRLLRRAGPFFLAFIVVFAPAVFVLWIFNRLLQYVLGEAPEQTQLTLARNELQRVIDEGHAAGILSRAQRQLINGMFLLGNQPLVRFAVPLSRLPVASRGTSAEQMLHLAQRFRASAVLITEPAQREPTSYLRVDDIYLAKTPADLKPRKLIAIEHRETPIGALHRLQSENQVLARIVDDYGRTVGMLTDRVLFEQLLART